LWKLCKGLASIFRKILDKIRRERLFKYGDKVILACSGGPDSVALLDILGRIKHLFNLKVFVAYFNHGLRPKESERERDFVMGLSKKYGFNFTSGKGDVQGFARKNKVSVQEAGRHLRYNFLFKLGKKLNIHKIVLGHHRDDNVETILLSFLKGAGLKGLSGIEAVRERDKFLLLRPMCEISKDEINFYLSERGLKPCLDSSNLKKTYLRNRLRLEILPILRKNINARVDNAVLRLGEIYSKENAYLDEVVSKNIKKVIKEKGGRIDINRDNFLKSHTAIQRRFLREVFDRIGIIGEGSNFQQIEILRNFILTCNAGQKLNLARGFIVKGGYPQDGFAYGHIYIEKGTVRSPQGRHESRLVRGIKVNIPGETLIRQLNLKVGARFLKKAPSLKVIKRSFPEEVYLDAEKIKLPIYLRARKPGDSFRPLGMKGSIKVKKYFINVRIPQEERQDIPLAVMGGEIIWVVGHAISEKVKVTTSTKNVLAIRQIP